MVSYFSQRVQSAVQIKCIFLKIVVHNVTNGQCFCVFAYNKYFSSAFIKATEKNDKSVTVTIC